MSKGSSICPRTTYSLPSSSRRHGLPIVLQRVDVSAWLDPIEVSQDVVHHPVLGLARIVASHVLRASPRAVGPLVLVLDFAGCFCDPLHLIGP